MENTSSVKLPSATIGIVRSRKDYFDSALRSAKNQFYPGELDIVVVENYDRKKTIGKCFNEIAEKSTHEWVLYLGDDDILVPEYVLSLICKTFESNENIVCSASYCTMFNKNEKKTLNRLVTSIWKRQYVIDNRFDEEMTKYVDTEFFERTCKSGEGKIILASHQYGYYYRQHDDNVSGNKFEALKKASEG